MAVSCSLPFLYDKRHASSLRFVVGIGPYRLFCFIVDVFLCGDSLGDGDTDRREILHDGTYRCRTCLFRFGGGTQGIPKIQHFGRLKSYR